jgi:hypothetical protein
LRTSKLTGILPASTLTTPNFAPNMGMNVVIPSRFLASLCVSLLRRGIAKALYFRAFRYISPTHRQLETCLGGLCSAIELHPQNHRNRTNRPPPWLRARSAGTLRRHACVARH